MREPYNCGLIHVLYVQCISPAAALEIRSAVRADIRVRSNTPCPLPTLVYLAPSYFVPTSFIATMSLSCKVFEILPSFLPKFQGSYDPGHAPFGVNMSNYYSSWSTCVPNLKCLALPWPEMWKGPKCTKVGHFGVRGHSRSSTMPPFDRLHIRIAISHPLQPYRYLVPCWDIALFCQILKWSRDPGHASFRDSMLSVD